MRRTISWLLPLAVVAGSAGLGATGAGGTAFATEPGIKDRLLAIPGMSLIEEKPADGHRFFLLNYEQPIDHRHPGKGTFQQRISVLHKDDDRPTVFETSGYDLNEKPSRSEPTRMVDGNQVSMEYRFFTPSRPHPADWSKLNIRQAADDQHRVFSALHRIYDQKWISTGASKGGSTATYYRRFHPHDMDGTVSYVAPNDMDNSENSAYYDFFKKVGTKKCRDRLNAAQHEIFERRPEMVARLKTWAKQKRYTFRLAGSADKAFELTAQDVVWGFWQYHPQSECDAVPGANASTERLYKWVGDIGDWKSSTDQSMRTYVPYYYQAGTQMGSPDYEEPLLDDVRRHPGLNVPRTYVPRDIPMKYDGGKAMRDIDQWVRTDSSRMLFINGQNDPWSAEPFRVGDGSKDAHVYVAPGQNHGAQISTLARDDRAAATKSLLKWAGVADEAQGEPGKPGAAPKPLARYDAKLDEHGPRPAARP